MRMILRFIGICQREHGRGRGRDFAYRISDYVIIRLGILYSIFVGDDHICRIRLYMI
ncbi:MAG TPA: hypothetical protein GXX70_07425 [Tepidimicrobium sp.]|nr:hypothetical protein [Tepidimicrobium sp.]